MALSSDTTPWPTIDPEELAWLTTAQMIARGVFRQAPILEVVGALTAAQHR